ncbi:MAG: hypothetical protein KKH41_09085 [Candidatus Thermoplasmatota archaeon]|nr:hypothetical protein [Euryarchaeota archaeon]MBU4032828.1 hypothetical protein [Candidatus Thermoplasmatota archaeon]MBU4071553.1 hypothetical protein [Candidatus Thermoplasmatota archaeon]MBU4144487.1 hypothetical protein [Candidatus Thermoplasmatota archaeon]MBU4592719.1 hypothetical protein [Candidatus Thermoplasmatota archaeon]
MVSQKDIQVLENIIVEYSGPMGKFVIKKSIADMGVAPESIVGHHRMRLIDLVLERAVFDRERWATVKKEILTVWDNGVSDA